MGEIATTTVIPMKKITSQLLVVTVIVDEMAMAGDLICSTTSFVGLYIHLNWNREEWSEWRGGIGVNRLLFFLLYVVFFLTKNL